MIVRQVSKLIYLYFELSKWNLIFSYYIHIAVHNNTVRYQISLRFDMDKALEVLETTNRVKIKKRVSISWFNFDSNHS